MSHSDADLAMTGKVDIAGVVLAGGLGRRMGSVDKGLQRLRGKAMVERVLERFAPQVGEVLISANQNVALYAGFGHPVIADIVAGFAGPLAGLHAALTATSLPLVASVSCDSPFLPKDLVSRLRRSLEVQKADLAVASTVDQPHPVFCLCRRELVGHLAAFLDVGGRKVGLWYATLNVVEVAFDDQVEAFSNINTREELASFER
jgi:molybdopterin-guanine dinucleotide biosynthesis protein A